LELVTLRLGFLVLLLPLLLLPELTVDYEKSDNLLKVAVITKNWLQVGSVVLWFIHGFDYRWRVAPALLTHGHYFQ